MRVICQTVVQTISKKSGKITIHKTLPSCFLPIIISNIFNKDENVHRYEIREEKDKLLVNIIREKASNFVYVID